MTGIPLTTLAYLASAIDTQGIIRTRQAGDTELPMVALHGADSRLLNYLAEMTETRAIMTRRAYSRAGCAEHCAEKHQHVVSVSGRWSVTGAKATILLYNIRPYVLFQREAVRSALAIGTNAPFKPATIQKMVALGWEIPDFG